MRYMCETFCLLTFRHCTVYVPKVVFVLNLDNVAFWLLSIVVFAVCA